MNDKYTFIEGKFTWCFETQRVFGGKRRVMLIQKGCHIVGKLLWHPGAKQIVFSARHNATRELIDYVRPKMVADVFYMLSRLDRKKRKDKSE